MRRMKWGLVLLAAMGLVGFSHAITLQDFQGLTVGQYVSGVDTNLDVGAQVWSPDMKINIVDDSGVGGTDPFGPLGNQSARIFSNAVNFNVSYGFEEVSGKGIMSLDFNYDGGGDFFRVQGFGYDDGIWHNAWILTIQEDGSMELYDGASHILDQTLTMGINHTLAFEFDVVKEQLVAKLDGTPLTSGGAPVFGFRVTTPYVNVLQMEARDNADVYVDNLELVSTGPSLPTVDFESPLTVGEFVAGTHAPA
ncbi:MAG: hypothetical protein ABFR33_09595, partial [Verrucomicrobiota bacterium]